MYVKKNNKELNIDYLVALLPLVVYGFYKNYFIVYNRGLITFSFVIKQIVIFILAIAVAILIPILVNILQKKKWHDGILKDYTIPLVIIIFLIMPVKYNKLIFLILLAVFVCLNSFFKPNKFPFNRLALFQIIALFILSHFGGIAYESIYESTKELSFTLFNSFFGRSVMNFGTTNIFLILCAFAYLTVRGYYKKEIPITIILVYLLSGIGINFLMHKDVLSIFSTLITTNILFSTIFVSTIPFYSPYTKEGTIIYSILIGLFTSIFSIYFPLNVVIFVIIFIVSLLNPLLDNLVLKIKEERQSENK